MAEENVFRSCSRRKRFVISSKHFRKRGWFWQSGLENNCYRSISPSSARPRPGATMPVDVTFFARNRKVHPASASRMPRVPHLKIRSPFAWISVPTKISVPPDSNSWWSVSNALFSWSRISINANNLFPGNNCLASALRLSVLISKKKALIDPHRRTSQEFQNLPVWWHIKWGAEPAFPCDELPIFWLLQLLLRILTF